MRQRARVVFRVGRNFRESDVADCPDDFLELPIRNRRAVHPERRDGDTMRRRLFRIMPIRTHAESAARNANHVRIGPMAVHRTFETLIGLAAMEQHYVSCATKSE